MAQVHAFFTSEAALGEAHTLPACLKLKRYPERVRAGLVARCVRRPCVGCFVFGRASAPVAGRQT